MNAKDFWHIMLDLSSVIGKIFLKSILFMKIQFKLILVDSNYTRAINFSTVFHLKLLSTAPQECPRLLPESLLPIYYRAVPSPLYLIFLFPCIFVPDIKL